MRILLTLLALLLSPNAHAQSHGLAMHGAPTYTADSPHLSYANPAAPKGGTLKHQAIGTFDTLNPYTIKGKSAAGLGLVYDRLMTRVWDEPFTMYPQIAQSYTMPADRSAISFTLDPRARFHDDSPITTADVNFTFETLRDYGRPNQRRIYKLVSAVETTETTIKFTFGKGFDQETALILAMMPVLSQADWADKDFDSTTLTPPLGSGPYRIESVDAGRQITYQRVPDYWAANHFTAKGLFNFDTISYDYFRDDGVALEAFKSGATTLRRENNIARWNAAYNTPAVKSGDITKHTIPHQRPEKARGLIYNTRRAPFDDIRVRHALSHLLDEKWINKNIYYGEYKRINSFYPNSELAANNQPPANTDRRALLRKANRLLDKAGWTIQDGQRIKDGQPLTFEILLGAPEDEKIALNFKQSLKKAGITTNIRVLDTAAYRGRLNEYDFDMTLYHWLSSLSPGTEQMLYYSCEAANQPARWNFPGICTPEIDALAASIAQSTTREQLLTRTKQLDAKLMAGHYTIPLFHSGADNIATWKPIARPEKTPIYGSVIETWWMDLDE